MSDEAWLIVQYHAQVRSGLSAYDREGLERLFPGRSGGNDVLTVRLKDDFTIGRVMGNDLVLPRGNIGKRHARIVLREGKWIIVDIASSNGVYVNGKRLSKPQVLKDGDKIYPGNFSLVFRDPLPVIVDVKRHGPWLTVNGSVGAVCPAVDVATARGVVSAVRGALPLGVVVLDQVDGLTFVEDIGGVWFTELLDTTSAGARIDASVVAVVARAALRSSSASVKSLLDDVFSPWLTFEGRVLPMTAMAAADPRAPRMTLQAIADALEPGLLLVEGVQDRL